MAVQSGSSTTPISPQVIGNAFVQQYYRILHETPDQVHKFYQDTSNLARSTPDGVMEYVSTLNEINKKFMCMDFSNHLTEIETADAQLSHKDGVLIVVTGSLTAADGVCRRFTQSFFLAPQESGGYFVLNDVFRFITERPSAVTNQIVNQENESNQNTGSVAATEIVEEPPTQDRSVVENDVTDGESMNPIVYDTSIENNVTVEQTVQVAKGDSKRAPVAAAPAPLAQKDVTKTSYASIVMKECPPGPVVKSKPASKPTIKAIEGQEKPSVKLSQAIETTQAGNNVSEGNASHDEQGFSVFVKSLPINATVQMVEEEFKKFGAIKPGGVQVRNNKVDRFFFGFIEFESQQSMQAAIQASPILIGEKEVYVEEKRTTTRVVNGVVINNSGGGGRFQSGRGGYRSDNFRGKGGGGYVNNGNYRGGDNFSRRNDGDSFNNRRNDFRNRNEFSGRSRGPPSPGNGYHLNGNGFHPSRPFPNGNGRFPRVNGPKQTTVAA